jgi:Inorganic H+ pyrophosphatase
MHTPACHSYHRTPGMRVTLQHDALLLPLLCPTCAHTTGALVMLSPIIAGMLFGTRTLAGMLAGALVSGVQMAVSMSNTGGAWDNAKKYIEVRCVAGGNSGCWWVQDYYWCM